jgi:starch phosphorylase
LAEKSPFPRIPALQVADIELPEAVEKLYDVAYNFWWSWNPTARRLFASIDGPTWVRYRNPVELLLNFDRHQWEILVQSDSFMENYTWVTTELERYLNPTEPTWFARRYPDYEKGPMAYFSMEYGIDQSMAVYSGGLGVLSGDHCKTASDLGLPFVALGLLYRFGYFRQAVDADGFQQHIYPEYDFNRLPVRPALDGRGREVVVRVPIPASEIAAKVWLAQVGRVPLLLMDTDIPENDPAHRPITNVLYVRGREMRLLQEMVLGIGGVRALKTLGIEPSVWHINEGHSSLLQLERLRRCVEDRGLSAQMALDQIRRETVFTTHTPVPAGNEQYERSLAGHYLEPWVEWLGTDLEWLLSLGAADHGEPEQPLNLSALALRTSTYANGVSLLNGEVSDRMWRHLFPEKPPDEPAIDAITNGVHISTWLGQELRVLFGRLLSTGWPEALHGVEGWKRLEELDLERLWAAHLSQKKRLMHFVRSRLLEQYARHGRGPTDLRAVEQLIWDEPLTIGFARRFATYKRAGLLFSDLHRLRHLLIHRERPIQVFVAGKAHPADRPGQELIQHLFRLSQERDLQGRIVFLENYDIRVAKKLVQGVDLWLNTPRRLMEASGTSGQKAAINGVLNCSILDGWWPEAFDGENGWAIGPDVEPGDDWRQDQEDALALYQLLEEEIVPAFYDRDENGLPRRWAEMMRHSIVTVGARFSASRMLKDYVEHAYAPRFSVKRDAAADGLSEPNQAGSE